jgi:hypothetical protein
VSERAESGERTEEPRAVLSLTHEEIQTLLGWWGVVYGEGMTALEDDRLMSALESARSRLELSTATPYTRITEAANS